MRALLLVVLVACHPTPKTPAGESIASKQLCQLPDHEFRDDQIVRGPAPCGTEEVKHATLVALHVGVSNAGASKVTRWWRHGSVLHVNLLFECGGCHGDNLGDHPHPQLFAVAVTGVDRLAVTQVSAPCPPQDCSGVALY